MTYTQRLILAGLAALTAFTAVAARADTSATPEGLSLELIMQDPDWIGPPPENAYWSDDGKRVYFDRKRVGTKLRDWHVVDAAGGAAKVVPDTELSRIDAPRGDYDAERTRKVYVRNGDVFVKDLAAGTLRQLTRTAEAESDAMFMAVPATVAFKRGDNYFAYDLATGTLAQLTDLRLEDDPAAPKPKFDFLEDQALRLSSTLERNKRETEQRQMRDRELQRIDPLRPPLPVFLGGGIKIESTLLSPNGQWVLVVTEPKNGGGKTDTMPNYVTKSGYVEQRSVRTLVGHDAPPQQTALLVDLRSGEKLSLDPAQLPGIKDDPFKGMRQGAINWHVKHGADKAAAEKALTAPQQRAVRIEGAAWNDTGDQIAVQYHSVDNKDRWLATVDFQKRQLVTQHRLTDPAWINWDFNEFGWLPDNVTLWYLSEESGYSQLYARDVAKRRTRPLTRGTFEVSAPTVDRAGARIYFLANVEHPGRYEVHRVDVASGEMEKLTAIGARSEHLRAGGDGGLTYGLSPDESQLLFKHDSSTLPPELYVQENRPGAEARRITDTISAQFSALPWRAPEVVAIPSKNQAKPIYSRVYLPKGYDASKKWPAVMFVHGAGYLQNAHMHWSSYFREFMFHNLLAQKGYVVIDMDYRASQGYGRDWRTAIYRQMGTPELEDFRDGVEWLVANRSVDAGKVGVYGGSYGGFMTFMALFKDPELFAAGAALRPVTDWAHYNHEYTSNILNTPAIDPVAFEVSSPLEHVEGLKRPLLFCHGMQDDNVFVKDSVRLVQRLIELKKENWEFAAYPLDPHGFVNPESWLDEYRRIYKLFETHLR